MTSYHRKQQWKHKQRIGNLGDILGQLTEEQVDWLFIKAAKWQAETIAEVVLEIVRDNHTDEIAGK